MRDPIAIFETAYDLSGSEEEWLERLAATARRNLLDGRWVVAATYDANGAELETRASVYCGLAESVAADMLATLLPLRALVAPLAERWPCRRIFRHPFVRALSEVPLLVRRAGLGASTARELDRALSDWFRRWGIGDQLWVNAQDPLAIGCCIVAPSDRRRPLTPRELHRWTCATTHIAAGFRVRRQLDRWAPANSNARVSAASLEAVEAVFTPDGVLKHAESACIGSARAMLRNCVMAAERARGPLRRRDPDEAAELWQGLVAGRWSLVDHFDSDGRRFVLAHRNEAATDARGLTLRERQVIAFAQLGHSNKAIAYELGLSTSTVATHLHHARTKLRRLSNARVLAPLPHQPLARDRLVDG